MRMPQRPLPKTSCLRGWILQMDHLVPETNNVAEEVQAREVQTDRVANHEDLAVDEIEPVADDQALTVDERVGEADISGPLRGPVDNRQDDRWT